jgi:hypothetical protein
MTQIRVARSTDEFIASLAADIAENVGRTVTPAASNFLAIIKELD